MAALVWRTRWCQTWLPIANHATMYHKLTRLLATDVSSALPTPAYFTTLTTCSYYMYQHGLCISNTCMYSYHPSTQAVCMYIFCPACDKPSTCHGTPGSLSWTPNLWASKLNGFLFSYCDEHTNKFLVVLTCHGKRARNSTKTNIQLKNQHLSK